MDILGSFSAVFILLILELCCIHQNEGIYCDINLMCIFGILLQSNCLPLMESLLQPRANYFRRTAIFESYPEMKVDLCCRCSVNLNCLFNETF